MDAKNNMDKTDNKTIEKDAAVCDATDKIAADFDNILAFLQAVKVKVPRVAAAPLSVFS